MHVGCKYKVGDIIKGLEIISEPYKVLGKRDYRAIVRCIFCGKEYEIVLSEIHRHIFDGCGCQKDRSNSLKWKSFKALFLLKILKKKIIMRVLYNFHPASHTVYILNNHWTIIKDKKLTLVIHY